MNGKQEFLIFLNSRKYGFILSKDIQNFFQGIFSEIYIKKMISEFVDKGILRYVGFKKGLFRIVGKKLGNKDFLYLGCLLNENGIISMDTSLSYFGIHENQKKNIEIILKGGTNTNRYKGFNYEGYHYSFYSLKENLFNIDFIYDDGLKIYEKEKAFLDLLYIKFINGADKDQFDLKKYNLDFLDKEKLEKYLYNLDYPITLKNYVEKNIMNRINNQNIGFGGIDLSSFNENDGLIL